MNNDKIIKLIIILQIILVFFYTNRIFASEIKKVDFDTSMGIEDKNLYVLNFKHNKSKQFMDFYRSLFNKNFFIPAKTKTIIPKIIHYVWIGDKPLPRLYQSYIKTCKTLHPNWHFKIWTNHNIHKLEFNKKLYSQLNGKYITNQKNLLFLSILKQYGGVALDVDYVCVKPLDELNHKYKFYVGLEPPNGWSLMPLTSFSLMASTANSDIIELININVNKFYQNQEINANFQKTLCPIEKGLRGAGQLCIGGALKYYCSNNNCNRIMVFPATYFNPIFTDPFKYRIKQKVPRHFYPYTKIYPESILIQDWNESTNSLFLADMHNK